jgi:hypothetical protein
LPVNFSPEVEPDISTAVELTATQSALSKVPEQVKLRTDCADRVLGRYARFDLNGLNANRSDRQSFRSRQLFFSAACQQQHSERRDLKATPPKFESFASSILWQAGRPTNHSDTRVGSE